MRHTHNCLLTHVPPLPFTPTQKRAHTVACSLTYHPYPSPPHKNMHTQLPAHSCTTPTLHPHTKTCTHSCLLTHVPPLPFTPTQKCAHTVACSLMYHPYPSPPHKNVHTQLPAHSRSTPTLHPHTKTCTTHVCVLLVCTSLVSQQVWMLVPQI